MSLIILAAICGVVLGILVGYFLATWLLIVLTIVSCAMLYGLVYPKKGSGTANLGIFLLFGPCIFFFLITMWITWFFAPNGMAHFIDYGAIWDFIKNALLR